MQKYLNQLMQLPLEELNWFLETRKEYILIRNFNDIDCNNIKDDMEREAFFKGYLDIVNMLDGIEECV